MGDPRALGAELRLYRRIAGARIRGQMQYKASFWLQLWGVFSINVLELATIFILFRQFDTMAGWTAGEVAFLYGLSAIGFSIAKVIGAGLDGFSLLMLKGEFDRMLIRPMSPLAQVLCGDIRLHQIGRLLQGAIALGIALSLVEIEWTAARVVVFLLSLLSTALVFAALFLFDATLCFWTTQSTEAMNAFTYGGTTLAQYPLHIFDRWLRRLFLWVIPIGFTVFLPGTFLLDKPDPLGLPRFAPFAAPFVALAFAVAVGFFWRFGVSRYRSTGS